MVLLSQVSKKFFGNLKRKSGSASIMAIMVLTFLTISCAALQERISNYAKSEWIDLQSENLLRKAEGATIITEEKIVEATQRLYDICTYRNDFKNRIESFSYRKQYVSEIERLSDVNMDNVKIDVIRDDIAEDGSGLYKFWVYVTVSEKEYKMKRTMMLCVTMKNLLKDKPPEEENNKGENNENIDSENGENINGVNTSGGDGTENQEKPEEKPEEIIPEKVNARDALIFRVEKE